MHDMIKICARGNCPFERTQGKITTCTTSGCTLSCVTVSICALDEAFPDFIAGKPHAITSLFARGPLLSVISGPFALLSVMSGSNQSVKDIH